MALIEDIPQLVSEALGRHGVPGVSVAVLADGEVTQTAAGTLNTETDVGVTTDSVFQIGSITKLMTAVMTMQLVEEGRLELDRPVRDVLPTFSVGDETVSATVTPRHLLNHSSGIDGDFFVDTGKGVGMLERLLQRGQSLGQLHPMGAGFSYCNFGFAVLGRIIEKVDGIEWSDSLHRRIARPLGTDFLHTRPEDLLRRRAAIGHVPDPLTGRPVPVRHPFLPSAMGPAGATPMCRARDLVDFARVLLDGGNPLLSPASVGEMLTPATSTVNSGALRSFGLGFMFFDWGGTALFGHDGSTVGQNSFLRIHESGVALSILANGGDVQGLAHEVMTAFFSDLIGAAPPEPIEGTAQSVDSSRYRGTYGRGLTTIVVEGDTDELRMSSGPGHAWSAGLVPPAGPHVLRPIDDETFTYRLPGARWPLTVKFTDDSGSDGYRNLHAGLRCNPRLPRGTGG